MPDRDEAFDDLLDLLSELLADELTREPDVQEATAVTDANACPENQ